jgi:Zn-dependent M32 family carboxypeptidase
MQAIGFDFEHGRLDISHHPFCGGVPSDVRMTTRYRTDEFLSSLMGILHETGHGLYEQGLPPQWSHWPVGRARGMAAHESQSLFVEMQIARSPNSGNGPCRCGCIWAPSALGREIEPQACIASSPLIRVEADE